MTLFDVVMKNLRHNFRQYFIYMTSMVFSILIYFTFISLLYNEQIASVSSLNDKMQPLLHVASFILLLFMVIFIGYSNTFFIQKRKREIGLYALLGTPKKKIAVMLCYENALLSILALVLGIVLGQLFSTFFSMIVIKLMGYSIVIQFTINDVAIVQTVVVFAMMTCITSLQGYAILYRFQLIDLFHAENKVQSSRKPSIVTALFSFCFIGMSYWMLLTAVDSTSWHDHFGRNLFLTIVLMVVGSYFFFHSLCGFFVRILQNNKSIYYKWRNLLTFTQFISRLKSNAIMLTIISLLNGMTLVAFGFAYAIYYNTLHTMEDHVPFSYQYEVISEELDQEMTALIQSNQDYPLLVDERFDYVMVNGQVIDLEIIPNGFTYYNEQFAVLSETIYNRLAKQLQRTPLSSLSESETVIVGNNFIGSQKKDENVGHSLALLLANEDITLSIIQNNIESIFNDNVQPSVLIVNDTIYQKLQSEYSPITSHVFKVGNEKQSAALTEQLQVLFETRLTSNQKNLIELEPFGTVFYSFSESYQEAQSIYGMIIFTFGFLGLVFLSATGSIIYFKMLTEAEGDQQRYMTLRNVGMSRRKVQQVIVRQYMIMFLLPLLVGIVHSFMMLMSLSKVMDLNMMTPVFISTAVYSALYGCYYKMTVVAGNKLVN